MANQSTVDQNRIDEISASLGLNNSSASPLLDGFIQKSHQSLITNQAYQTNLLKLSQAQNSLQNNTSAAQTAIQDSQNQMLDANYAAKQKQAQSGVGNTGLAALNTVNTNATNVNISRQLEQTARSNQETRKSIDLYNTGVNNALQQDVYGALVDARNTGALGWNDDAGFDYNGSQVSSSDYWELENVLKDNSGNSGRNPITEDDRKESEKHR